MTLFSEYYEKNLYPLQDGVLNSVEKCRTQFYLTGGTALSRGFFNHRYSDDLDFFLNNESDFYNQVNKVLDQLRKDDFLWSTEENYFRTSNYCSLVINKNDVLLKLDFVNDVAPHFGSMVETKIYSRTDPLRNILSNKLTSLFRYEGKDIADLREIALNTNFNWIEIIEEARQKETGLELPVAAEILKGIPQNVFESIRWINLPKWEDFLDDINTIIQDMLQGVDNSLVLANS